MLDQIQKKIHHLENLESLLFAVFHRLQTKSLLMCRMYFPPDIAHYLYVALQRNIDF